VNARLLRLMAVALVISTAGVVVEAAPVRAAAPTQMSDPRANIVIGGLKLLLGRSTSARVFRNVDEVTTALNARYDQYEQTAAAAGNERVLKLLQEERKALLAQLAAVRQNAYDKFRAPETMTLISTIANTGPVNNLLGHASTEIADLAQKVGDLRTSIGQGGTVNLQEVGDLAGRLERWTGVWAVVSGPSGRGLRQAAEGAAASLRDIEQAGQRVDTELAAVQSDLTLLSQTLTAVKDVPRRPRAVACSASSPTCWVSTATSSTCSARSSTRGCATSPACRRPSWSVSSTRRSPR
jgi:hypothetical protein